jgi:hypothetical protein
MGNGSGSVWIVIGAILMVTSWLLRRGHTRRIELLRRNPLAEAKASIRASEVTPEAEWVRREVRLHDLVRENEARLNSRIVVLQELISEADRASARIEQLLAAAGLSPPAEPEAERPTGDKRFSDREAA